MDFVKGTHPVVRVLVCFNSALRQGTGDICTGISQGENLTWGGVQKAASTLAFHELDKLITVLFKPIRKAFN